MTPEAVAASLDEARKFFPHHFPTSTTRRSPAARGCLARSCWSTCPGDSSIVRFQRRFELEPYEEHEGLDADVEALRFVFRTLSTPLDQLPRRTMLQRAIVDHLKASRHWSWRCGSFPI
jgi:hypothetical protein